MAKEKKENFKQEINFKIKKLIDDCNIKSKDRFEQGYLEGLLRAYEITGYYEGYPKNEEENDR